MNLDSWLQTISTQHPQAIALGLERVSRVAQQMGLSPAGHHVSLGCVAIVVGGTNGKGSTCALMESMLLACGFRVATYTSPHLIEFNERLRFDGQAAADALWIAGFEQVEAARGDVPLTYFEYATLAAFSAIVRAKPDVAILEIGLGGRLDAVNIVDADCSVLTSVDLDHQALLGATREQIGWEKAHIARHGKPFIVADPAAPVTVFEVAQSIGADIWRLGEDFNFQGDRQQWSWAGRGTRRNAMAYPALRGVNQLLNASAALAALASLKDKIPVTQGGVRQGLALVELPGRFQVLAGQPTVILDVAHNPHAAGVLAANLGQMGFYPNTHAVVGMLSDKDAEAVFSKLAGTIDHWHLASLSGPEASGRARTAQALKDALMRVHPSAHVDCYDSPEAAYAAAQSCVEPNDRIVVFGSFLTVAHVIKLRHVR